MERETSFRPDNAIVVLDELFDRLLQLASSTAVARNIMLHPHKENGKQLSIYIDWSGFSQAGSLSRSVNSHPIVTMSLEKTCIDASLVELFDIKPSNPISKDLVIENIVRVRVIAEGLVNVWLRYIDHIDLLIHFRREWVAEENKTCQSRIEGVRNIIAELDHLSMKIINDGGDVIPADMARVPQVILVPLRDWTDELLGRYPKYKWPSPASKTRCTIM